jgi:hypothetical protein
MYYGKAQETADRFKALLNDLIIDASLKQETLAYHGSIKQNTVSQWIDPQSDRHLPAFQLLLLPSEIAVPICSEVLRRFGKIVAENVFDLPTDGHVDDNLLNIDMIQGDIIRKKEKDPKGALKFCDDLIREAQITKKELEEKFGR